ncbi:MAG: hypothetical protein ACK4G3_07620 [bacterium]
MPFKNVSKSVKSLFSPRRFVQLLRSSTGSKLLLSHILIVVVNGLVFAGVGSH